MNANVIEPDVVAETPGTNCTFTVSSLEPVPLDGETMSHGELEVAVHVTVPDPICVSRSGCALVCQTNDAPVVTTPKFRNARSSETSAREEHPEPQPA